MQRKCRIALISLTCFILTDFTSLSRDKKKHKKASNSLAKVNLVYLSKKNPGLCPFCDSIKTEIAIKKRVDIRPKKKNTLTLLHYLF